MAVNLLWGFFRKQQEDALERPFCFRDTGDQLFVLSNVKPSTESHEIKFQRGQTLMFEIRMSLGVKRNRETVVKPQDLTADQIKRRFITIFSDVANVDYVTFKKLPPHIITRNDGHRMPLNQTMFYGTLTVKDPLKFDEKISRGVGRGCAFGFGAMILPQVMK